MVSKRIKTCSYGHRFTSKDMCIWRSYLGWYKQLFCQYDLFNRDTFLDHLKQIKKRLGGRKVILIIDRQGSSTQVKECWNIWKKIRILIIYLPKGSPQFNVVEEECLRQGKHDLLVSKYYSQFTDLKSTISRYYRTRRFNLNIVKYLLRDD